MIGVLSVGRQHDAIVKRHRLHGTLSNYYGCRKNMCVIDSGIEIMNRINSHTS